MNNSINREKSLEILLERLIMMVGKSNERAESLHRRVLQLERILIERASELNEDKKTYIS